MSAQVIISSVTKLYAYPTALAAQDAGMLLRFITSIYYKSQSWSYRALDRVLAWLPQERERLRGRRLAELDDSRVVTLPWGELFQHFCARRRFRFHNCDHRTVQYLWCELYDWLVARRYLKRCDIFHGFEQAALYSMRKAKSLGAVTILDQSVPHTNTWHRIEQEECERWGVPFSRRPGGYWQHIRRKYRELEAADYYITCLDFDKRTLVENGIAADRIYHVPLGTDTARFQPVDRSNRTTFNILFIGQTDWYKGIHYLLDVYRRWKLPNTKLTVIGSAAGEWQTLLERRLSQLGNPYEYLPGVPHNEIERYYAEADVFAFPCMAGGIGRVVYEAMSTGLPVIVSDGDIVIRDGVDGFVCPPRETERIEALLVCLFHNRTLCAEVGRNGAERVKQFTWESYRRGVIDVYTDILRRRGVPDSRRRDSEPALVTPHRASSLHP